LLGTVSFIKALFDKKERITDKLAYSG
jgi:hypothetical protein